MLLDALAKRWSPAHVLDVGTGTAILALAAGSLWPCKVLATDIDPQAVDVARDNGVRNGFAHGVARNQLRVLCASGLRHPELKARAFDLVIANILAQPLIQMAGSLARSVKPGGYLILSGLLESQKRRVLAAYRARGLRFVLQEQRSDWPSLLLYKPIAL
jgi:ribosomal protein L11 methyltransferase